MTAHCLRAGRRGVRLGLPLVEAQVLVPQGWFAPHDPEADYEALRELAWSCQTFTPRAGIETAPTPDSLWLDVTGCVEHFGNLEQLCLAVLKHFRQRGFEARVAAAPTFGAAWGLVRYAAPPRTQPRTQPPRDGTKPRQTRAVRQSTPLAPPLIVESATLSSALSTLPTAALRLPPTVQSLLAECGLQTIGAVTEIPRSSLPARFDARLLTRLDEAWGRRDEPLIPELPPQPLIAQQSFEEPLVDPVAITFVLQHLLRSIVDQLVAQSRPTREIQIRWETESRSTGNFTVHLLRPTQLYGRIWELIPLQLERLSLPSGVTTLTLEALPGPPLTVTQRSLFSFALEDTSPPEQEDAFTRLIERLGSRLGEQAVQRVRLIPEDQPELSTLAESWLTARTNEMGQPASARRVATASPPTATTPLVVLAPVMKALTSERDRPLRLFGEPVPVAVAVDPRTDEPRQVAWRQRMEDIHLRIGPERIVTGWWRAPMIRRDYYRIETASGVRLWLFQDLRTTRWLVHGVFE